MNGYLSLLSGSSIENNLILVNSISDDLNTLTPNNVDIINTSNLSSNLLDLVYPIGSIYMSVNNTSPALLFGGSWTLIQDTFLLAAGSTYSGGSTGGAASINLAHTHTTLAGTTGGTSLTTAQLPAHTHGSKALTGTFMVYVWDEGSCSGVFTKTTSAKNLAATSGDKVGYVKYTLTATHEHTSVGSGSAHTHSLVAVDTNSKLSSTQSIMPPYLTVYMWLRTA